jgi:hypothetical protein
MGDINTANNLPGTPPDTMRVGPSRERPVISTSAPMAHELAPLDDDFQLTKLSSVLNGLKRGATVMRAQFVQAMGAVKSGTYKVDPMQVSRRIVGDSLAWPRG